MHTDGSEDGTQVEAAAGRAVGGSPPLSVTAAATASSLPPPPPSASDAVVQPRARDGTPNDAPRSNATRHTGERPSDDVENNSRLLDHLAAPSHGHNAGIAATATQIGATLDGMDEEDPPVPPAQIGAEDAVINELLQTPSIVEDVPMHPSQIATDFDNVDKAMEVPQIVEQIGDTLDRMDEEDPPVPPVQIGAEGAAINELKKTPPNVEDVPMHPSQIATDFDRVVKVMKVPQIIEQEEIVQRAMDHLPPADFDKMDAACLQRTYEQVRRQQEEILQQALDPPTPAAARAPSFPSADQGRSPSNPRSQQQLPVRLPPQYMMLSPDEDADPPVSTLPRDSSLRLLEATPVEDRPEAIVVPDLPVYDAVQVAEQTWMKKYKKYIFVGLGVLFGGAAVAAGVAASSNDRSSGSNTEVIERVVLSTARPSESSPPSDVPSLRPTLGPSQSLAPSTNPSQSQSVKPSTKSTLPPSSSPSKIPSSSLRPSPLPSSPPSTYLSTLIWNRQSLSFNGDASDDWLGHAVAFSADALTMAIGAPGPFRNDHRPGYVKVYRREREVSSWEQRGETLRGEANGDYFGGSLSLSEDGTTLSIGTPLHDAVGPDSGQVKVYEWKEAALNYMQIGDDLYGAVSGNRGNRFGYSLDISNGTILAVGAPYHSANGFISGQVAIYAWDEASSDFKQRGEAIDGDRAYDNFGVSVSLSGNGQKLAVGAPTSASNGSASGQVKVFEWNEATSNYEQLGDSLLGGNLGDWFGWSVSFSRDGTTLAIGAPFNKRNGPLYGQVKVFAWDEAASNFEQIGQSLYGKAADGEFGRSVVLSSEGKTLAIGAPYGSQPGYVEVYEWDEAASEYKRLGQSLGGEASEDGFGNALALADNGRDLVVGAPRNDRNGINSGRVEVFNIEL